MFMAPISPPAPRRTYDVLWLVLCVVAIAIAVLTLPVAASPRYRTAAPALNGELRIVGSRVMQGPVARWVAIFRREQPGVRIHVTLLGSGAAAGAMADGAADVAPMTRPLRSGERALFSREEAAPRAIPLGWGEIKAAQGSWRPAPLYLYLTRSPDTRVSPAATEFACIATSAEGMGRVRVSMLQLIAGNANAAS